MQEFAPSRKTMLEKIMEVLRTPGKPINPGQMVLKYGIQYFEGRIEGRGEEPLGQPPAPHAPPSWEPGRQDF